MIEVDTALLLRPYLGMDHDRAYINRARGVFALFDGAGEARASGLAFYALTGLVESSDSFDIEQAFAEIQSTIVDHRSDRDIFTTASLVHLDAENAKFQFAAAGDSPIYVFDHQRGDLEKLTIDESIRTPEGIVAHNFLGNPDHVLRQVGERALSSLCSILLLTDGITEARHLGAVKDDRLAEIMGSAPDARQAAHAIINAANVPDDATVIVVRIDNTR